MIFRIWRGETVPENADAYREHLMTEVFPRLGAMPGHKGAYLLRRDDGEHAEVLAVTLWDSMEAVSRFAGDTPEVAVVEPAAEAVLTAWDHEVRHYDVVLSSGV